MSKICILILTLFLPLCVFAADQRPTGIGAAGSNLQGLQGQGVGLSNDLPGTTASVVSAIFYVIGTIFLGLMIYGGVVWAKSAGREEEIGRAKKIIIASIAGLIVVMASYAIANFVLGQLGPSSGSEKGCCSYTNAQGMQFEEIDKTSCDTKNGEWQSGTCSP